MAEKEPVSLLPTAIIYSKLKLTDKNISKHNPLHSIHPILSPPKLRNALEKAGKEKKAPESDDKQHSLSANIRFW